MSYTFNTVVRKDRRITVPPNYKPGCAVRVTLEILKPEIKELSEKS